MSEQREPATGQVSLALMLRGFDEASRRFFDVMRSADPDATFLPLFEAINWAVSIDDRFTSIWEAKPRSMKPWTEGFMHGDVVKGVRFARNRVHHQWADALWRSTGSHPAEVGLIEWRWRLEPELPPGRKGFKAQYVDCVAARPARETLSELSDCFGDAHGALGADGSD